MIDLKVEDGNCQLKADGSSIKLGCEIAMAVHALTAAFAKTTNMSFESAALTIMQANTLINKKMSDENS